MDKQSVLKITTITAEYRGEYIQRSIMCDHINDEPYLSLNQLDKIIELEFGSMHQDFWEYSTFYIGEL